MEKNTAITFLLVFMYIVNNCAVGDATNPGLKIELSEKGLNFGANVVLDHFMNKLQGRSLPDYHGSDKVSIGHVDYDITSIPVRDSGSVDVRASGITLSVSVAMGVDRTGRPTIALTSCHVDVDDVSVDFHGGVSWLYNLFSSKVEDSLSGNLRSKICETLRHHVNNAGNKMLQGVKVKAPLGNVLTLDYRLVAAPMFGPDYAEFLHKGEVYWTANQTETPLEPHALRHPPGTPKMASFLMSDYIANTAGYSLYAHKAKLLKYNWTQADLPEDQSSYLETERFPLLAKAYPNSTIELHMQATQPPALSIRNDTPICHLRGESAFKLRLLNGELVHWFTLNVRAGVSVDVGLKDEFISARVKHFGFGTNITDVNIKPVPKKLIVSLFRYAVRSFIVPQINDLAAKHIPLPVLDDLHYFHPEIDIFNGTICFKADFRYKDQG